MSDRINSVQFKQLLASKLAANEPLIFTDLIVSNAIQLSAKDFHADTNTTALLEFENCEFTEMTFTGVETVSPLQFTNCKVFTKLSIGKSTIGNIVVSNSNIHSFHIVAGSIIYSLVPDTVYKQSTPNAVIIESRSVVSDFRIRTSEVHGLEVTNSYLDALIGDASDQAAIEIFKSEVTHIDLKHCNFEQPHYRHRTVRPILISVIDSILEKGISLTAVKGIRNISVNSSNRTTRIGCIRVSQGSNIDSISIAGGEIGLIEIDSRKNIGETIALNHLSLESTQIEQFRISASESQILIKRLSFIDSLVNKLFVESSASLCICDLLVLNSIIKQGLVLGRETSSGSGEKTNVLVENLRFERILGTNSVLMLNGVSVGKVEFDYFLNLGSLRFIECRFLDGQTQHEIRVTNSDLGDTQFYGCDFGGEKRTIHFENSRIMEISVIGQRLPWRLKAASEGTRIEQQLQLLAQLRKIYEDSNDMATSIHYQAEYLNALRKETKPSTFKGFFDRISLSLNWLSNSYGDDLGKASVSTFIVSLFLYIAYLWVRGYFVGSFSLPVFKHVVASFFEFLSPIRRTNILPPANRLFDGTFDYTKEFVPARVALISALSKIVIAYFLYQFVQAFRKYGRKS